MPRVTAGIACPCCGEIIEDDAEFEVVEEAWACEECGQVWYEREAAAYCEASHDGGQRRLEFGDGGWRDHDWSEAELRQFYRVQDAVGSHVVEPWLYRGRSVVVVPASRFL